MKIMGLKIESNLWVVAKYNFRFVISYLTRKTLPGLLHMTSYCLKHRALWTMTWFLRRLQDLVDKSNSFSSLEIESKTADTLGGGGCCCKSLLSTLSWTLHFSVILWCSKYLINSKCHNNQVFPFLYAYRMNLWLIQNFIKQLFPFLYAYRKNLLLIQNFIIINYSPFLHAYRKNLATLDSHFDYWDKKYLNLHLF
jgi:hypothetical protein